MSKVDAIINIRSIDEEKNPHVLSVYKEGLWGLSNKYRKGWERLEKGSRMLLYGSKGIWLAGIIEDKFENHKPVKYWDDNPTGFPLQFKLKILNSIKEAIPIRPEELVNDYKIYAARQYFARTSMVIFPDEDLDIKSTYKKKTFDKLWQHFSKKNRISHV